MDFLVLITMPLVYRVKLYLTNNVLIKKLQKQQGSRGAGVQRAENGPFVCIYSNTQDEVFDFWG